MRLTAIFTVFFLLLLVSRDLKSQELKPGDLSPNVKVLDIDEFGSFREGYCMVRKGTQGALIDTNGNYVLPFNHPFFPKTSDYQTGFSEGMCAVVDAKTGLIGFINKKMQLVIPCKYERADQFKNGYSLVSGIAGENASEGIGYINKEGKFFQYSKLPNYSPNPENATYVPCAKTINGKYLYGFCDFTGKVLIPPAYEQVRSFSEGMAAVMKSDEFGKPKWGYINTKGEQVIGLQYSNEPGDFHDGLAYVIPIDKSEFSFAYIDKKGNIKLKIDNSYLSLNKKIKYIATPNYKDGIGNFKEGLTAINYGGGLDYIMIDTNGKGFRFPVFKEPIFNRQSKQSFHSDSQTGYVGGHYAIQSSSFERGLAIYGINGHLYGVISKESEIVIPPVFNKLELPTGGTSLYRATYNLWEKDNKSKEIRDGFVNHKGVFTIIKGEGPKW